MDDRDGRRERVREICEMMMMIIIIIVSHAYIYLYKFEYNFDISSYFQSFHIIDDKEDDKEDM